MTSPLVAVTGPSGYLGRRVLAIAGTNAVTAVSLGRAQGVDLADRAAVLDAVRALRPAAIVHTGAANPGRPPEQFYPVNHAGSGHVADAAAAVGARLVHVSTDVVFDGRAAPYADDATTSPINHYGRSKASAEAAVAQRCPDAAIVRTSLIYGLDEPDRSTAGFIDRLAHGHTLSLFHDVVRQPVWVDALAAGLLRLATEFPDVAGTLNLAGDQPVDRATFGRRLLAHWGIDVDDRFADIAVADDPDLAATVPADLRLALERATDLGLACPGLDAVLPSR